MERKAWFRGLWEIMKAAFCQKLLTYRLPSPPLLLPNHFSGLSVIVTGATSGIGMQTAKELAMAGAHVTMACRNAEAARHIAREWRKQARHVRVPNVEVMAVDLLSLSSVRRFAAEWERRAIPLHVLINNAGIFLMGEPQQFSDDGIEQHMHVNHVAPALLSLLLLPSLLRAPSSRIINVNSVAHHCAVVDPKAWNCKINEQKFNNMRAYGESKLAHLMFLKTLARKLLEQKKTSIKCIAVHPGIVTTKLVRGSGRRSFWMLDPMQGARSVLFCVEGADVSDLEKGFVYYSCNCKPAKVSPQVDDVEACLGVWQKTLEVVGLHVDYINQVIA